MSQQSHAGGGIDLQGQGRSGSDVSIRQFFPWLTSLGPLRATCLHLVKCQSSSKYISQPPHPVHTGVMSALHQIFKVYVFTWAPLLDASMEGKPGREALRNPSCCSSHGTATPSGLPEANVQRCLAQHTELSAKVFQCSVKNNPWAHKRHLARLLDLRCCIYSLVSAVNLVQLCYWYLQISSDVL